MWSLCQRIFANRSIYKYSPEHLHRVYPSWFQFQDKPNFALLSIGMWETKPRDNSIDQNLIITLAILEFKIKFSSRWYSWNKLVHITWATSPNHIHILVKFSMMTFSRRRKLLTKLWNTHRKEWTKWQQIQRKERLQSCRPNSSSCFSPIAIDIHGTN